MGKRICHFFSAVLYRIRFILADEDDIHESLDKFEILPDPTTGLHGNRSGNNGKNGVVTFSRLFFTRSASYLHVIMTCMRVRRSKFDQIRLLTAELVALERLKKSPFLIKSFSYLKVTMTYMRAWMSSKFCQIQSGTTHARWCPLFSFHSCGYTWEMVR